MKKTQLSKSSEILSGIRAELAKRGWDACIIPDCDAHFSEDVAPENARLQAATGNLFTGDCGTALIDSRRARLFVDSRFWIQADGEMRESSWEVVHDGEIGIKSLPDAISSDASEACAEGKEKYVVGVNGALVTTSFCFEIQQMNSAIVVDVDSMENDIVDSVWTEKPCSLQPCAKVLDENVYGGPEKSAERKLSNLRSFLRDIHVGGYVVTALDEFSWLLNVRGNAVPCVPVIEAYALVLTEEAKDAERDIEKEVLSCASGMRDGAELVLFMHDEDVKAGGSAFLSHVNGLGALIRPYESVFSHISALASKNVLLASTKSTTSAAMVKTLGTQYRPVSISPLEVPRATKSPVEILNMARAHEDDSLAFVKLLAHLEDAVRSGQKLTEWDVCLLLEKERAAFKDYVGLSFPTIAGYGANGALAHYKPTAEKNGSTIGLGNMLLVDFGGHYAYGGTTDTTRTVFFGRHPPDKLKTVYTHVLQAHIALASAIFEEGVTCSMDLDGFARKKLQEFGLEYGHGTGHGIGALLAVHEQPFLGSRSKKPIMRGMVLTIEPGVYIEGEFGVRIESVGVVVPHKDIPGMCQFDIATRVPISLTLVDAALLTTEEKSWLNSYNLRCLESLRHRLENCTGNENALKYLERECSEIL